ncbi:PAS domain-containing protein [Alteromonas facilis]|uniref:PAS domain-containing protein n=1 Tax=Alteromonas facilis TaxID=2048004 RepID=UPI000C2868CC|nr:PAS domain-containing protein [Alteromonas facilis]
MSTNQEEMLFLSQIFNNVKPVSLIRQVLANSVTPIVITDAGQVDGQYKIIYANKAFCRLNGYELAEIVGLSPKILQGPNSNYDGLKKLSESLETTGYARGMSQNYRKDGSCYPVSWDISPIRNESGAVEMYISGQRDLTTLVERAKNAKTLNEQVINLINDLTSGKKQAENIKHSESKLLNSLKNNASNYVSTSATEADDADDDLFIELDAMDLVEEPNPPFQQRMSASEYLANGHLTQEEINTLIQTLRDIEEEVECLSAEQSDLSQIEFIREKIAQLSDDIFFLVEFTDTSLALNEVAEVLASIDDNTLTELHITVLKSLVEEVDTWLVGIFVTRTAQNIFDGAKSVNSAAKQFVSFVKPK